MAKKKATMTLKDFHGGSIPSDLPLPSAPGVIVKPSNHVGFDRQPAWGNPLGRSDHRLRPGSAGSVRNLDDKTPFLSHTAPIGRNFDEDERKPLDGGSAPRRTVSDDSSVPKLDNRSAGTVSDRPATTPVTHGSGGNVGSYAVRFSEVGSGGVNVSTLSGGALYSRGEGRASNQNVGRGPAVGGSSPNAWGLRKEPAVFMEPVAASWSAPDAVSKLAHASALEKISSGRWHSKQHGQVDVEVIRHSEVESEVYPKGGVYDKYAYSSMDVAGGREYNDATLARHADRSLAVDDGAHVGVRDLQDYKRSRSPMQPEAKDRKSPVSVDGAPVQSPRNAGIFGGSELQPPVSLEPLERPKLKLLPRSKPVDSVEPPVGYKQPYLQSSDPGVMNTGGETHRNADSAFHMLAGPENGNPAVERPKLSLRPRSQASEQVEGNPDRGRSVRENPSRMPQLPKVTFGSSRSTLFGGARPRELVLKERGIDDVVLNNHDVGQSPNRIKQDTPRTETLPLHATPIRHNGKVENPPLDHRIGKSSERRDNRVDAEKADVQQRRNWRNNDNRKSSRDLEKPQPQERPPSPETWRKPIEQPPSPGQRYGKASSAVELAQAFSRSVSEPKIAPDRFPGQRGLPTQGQVPFSRLTGPTPRPQINGY